MKPHVESARKTTIVNVIVSVEIVHDDSVPLEDVKTIAFDAATAKGCFSSGPNGSACANFLSKRFDSSYSV
jgi:hypothetical protein